MPIFKRLIGRNEVVFLKTEKTRITPGTVASYIISSRSDQA